MSKGFEEYAKDTYGASYRLEGHPYKADIEAAFAAGRALSRREAVEMVRNSQQILGADKAEALAAAIEAIPTVVE